MNKNLTEMTGKKSELQIKPLSIVVLSILLLSVSVVFLAAPIKESPPDGTTALSQHRTSEIKHNLASMPGWFTKNQGQIENHEVRFVYTGSGCSIGFVESGYLLKLKGEHNLTSVIKVTFEGSNPVVPQGKEELSHKSNYFIGNDLSEWRTGVPNYNKVVYENLYDGIDLIFYTTGKGLKYDFIVSPTTPSSPSPPAPGSAAPAHAEIRFSYEGIDSIYIDDNGDLHISTPVGELVEEAPFSYQIVDGKEVEVSSRYRIDSEKTEVPSHYRVDGKTVGFEIGNYNPAAVLVIDPLIYSTFVGGGDWDYGSDIVLDSESNAYITGWTYSSDFPTTPGCFDDTNHGGGDVVVFKLNHNGSDLLYSTFVGGSDRDWGRKIAIDSGNNVYITGYTGSSDFPTTSNCFDDSYGENYDVFVFKLNQDGSDLVYSTYLGGVEEDGGEQGKLGIAVDSGNNAYITGCTKSPDFPTTDGSYDRIYNYGADVFVSKLNPDGSDLVYSTFIGGRNSEYGDGIVLDSDNCAYITGRCSSDYPTTTGCFDDSHNGGFDVFVTKLNRDGTDLVYSTFIGGDGFDWGLGIALDSLNNAYITGNTRSEDFPTTPGCYDNSSNWENDLTAGDVFVTKLNPGGSDLVYSTYVGGSNRDRGLGIALDSGDNAHITGYAQSSDFPTTNGSFNESYNGGHRDVIVFKLNHNASTLVYSTYVGGNDDDEGCGIALDSENNAYITGRTHSSDFPATPGSFDESNNGEGDAFVFELDLKVETNGSGSDDGDYDGDYDGDGDGDGDGGDDDDDEELSDKLADNWYLVAGALVAVVVAGVVVFRRKRDAQSAERRMTSKRSIRQVGEEYYEEEEDEGSEEEEVIE